MRALVVTNIYPTEAHPATGTFIADQVRSICEIGVEVDLLFVDRARQGRRVYQTLSGHTQTRVATSEPHIVHVMYGGVMADIVTRVITDRPVLVTFHGDDLQGNRGNGLVGALSGRYSTAASARAARRAAGIITVSRTLFEALPKSLDSSRVWTIPNGIDLSRFTPRDRTECQHELGWNPRRAHILFPAPPARGEKRFPLANAAVRVLERSGIGVELHVLDAVPHDQVPMWLNASNAMVLTSIREGSPMVVKEALACNVPIVSVDVGDVRERLTGIEGCFMADPTPVDLSAKLRRVIERDDRIDGRDRVADLALERVAAKLQEIYGVLTNER